MLLSSDSVTCRAGALLGAVAYAEIAAIEKALHQQTTSNSPNPGVRPAVTSAADGCHLPVMTSCGLGLGAWGVIQNHKAVLKASTGLDATASGLLRPSNPRA